MFEIKDVSRIKFLNNIIPLNYDKFFKYHLIKLLGRFRKATQILEI